MSAVVSDVSSDTPHCPRGMSFYREHLARVSRSFAVCIEQLDAPLDRWVGLTYLLCRVVDTIEDAPWTSVLAQQESFRLASVLVDKYDSELFSEWVQGLPEGIPVAEKQLANDFVELLIDLEALPEEPRKIIRRLVRTMIHGMVYFVGLKKGLALKLKSVQEVNQYCFFVAGIVGEALTGLLAVQDHGMPLNKTTFLNATHFGLFLQKINILKDQKVDEGEGRFFVPSRKKLLLSMRVHAQAAMDYIRAIPPESLGYRVFSLWSLFLGLKTLPLLVGGAGGVGPEQGAVDGAAAVLAVEPIPHFPKISREETMTLFAMLKQHAGDLQAVEQIFATLTAAVSEFWATSSRSEVISSSEGCEVASLSEGRGVTSDTWFTQIYEGPLDLTELRQLGVV